MLGVQTCRSNLEPRPGRRLLAQNIAIQVSLDLHRTQTFFSLAVGRIAYPTPHRNKARHAQAANGIFCWAAAAPQGLPSRL